MMRSPTTYNDTREKPASRQSRQIGNRRAVRSPFGFIVGIDRVSDSNARDQAFISLGRFENEIGTNAEVD
jgi:hypothetical protein